MNAVFKWREREREGDCLRLRSRLTKVSKKSYTCSQRKPLQMLVVKL